MNSLALLHIFLGGMQLLDSLNNILDILDYFGMPKYNTPEISIVISFKVLFDTVMSMKTNYKLRCKQKWIQRSQFHKFKKKELG